MARIIPSLAAILLCSTALAGCSTLESLNPFGDSGPVADKAALEKQVRQSAMPTDIGSGVRMAHELRLDGKYDEASQILSQLMLVASDDPRVVGEYGKTLLQRGRLDDASQFLTRAAQLQSGDWTTWSALGVTYDQMGNQASAKFAYDHALALAPNEASVLSNYALSRLLANDVAGARILAGRAAAAGGSVDPKIARNIAMIEATAPPPAPQASAASAPQIVASAKPAPPATAPIASVQVTPQVAIAPPASRPAAAAPRPISTPTAEVVAPAPAKVAEAPGPAASQQPAAAKPVGVTPVASAAPRILLPQTAGNTPPGAQQYGVVVQAITPAPAKPAPVSHVAAVTPGNPAPVKTTSVAVAVKPEAVAPAAAKPVETAKPAPVKAAAVTQDGVPALRLASDAATP